MTPIGLYNSLNLGYKNTNLRVFYYKCSAITLDSNFKAPVISSAFCYTHKFSTLTI